MGEWESSIWTFPFLICIPHLPKCTVLGKILEATLLKWRTGFPSETWWALKGMRKVCVRMGCIVQWWQRALNAQWLLTTAFTSCPSSLSSPIQWKNVAHQSLGDAADRGFLSARASTSPEQSSVANCALPRANVLRLAKLVTGSHLTSGWPGHAVLLWAWKGFIKCSLMNSTNGFTRSHKFRGVPST